ncbi:MAG: condensation domain-containing protein, partial [Aurantibacter sp.]
MENVQKTKIEGIFPLTHIQQGLLFHSLSGGWDQGFLNVRCTLKGNLDQSNFMQAWKLAIKRHAVLRTTIHWENLEKPVQIVHQKKSMNINFLDWREDSPEEIEQKWKSLLASSRESGVNFEYGALLNLTLVAVEENVFRFLWPSHHLLVDGWSSHIVLKDVFEFYQALCNKTEPLFETLPSFKSYLGWVNKMNNEAVGSFWKGYFKNFEQAYLFDPSNKQVETVKPILKKLSLSEADTRSLRAFAQNHQVTINTVVQGVWAILLSKYFGSVDVVY